MFDVLAEFKTFILTILGEIYGNEKEIGTLGSSLDSGAWRGNRRAAHTLELSPEEGDFNVLAA